MAKIEMLLVNNKSFLFKREIEEGEVYIYITDKLYYFCSKCGNIYILPGKCTQNSCKGEILTEGGWGYLRYNCIECGQKFIVTGEISKNEVRCCLCQGLCKRPEVNNEFNIHIKVGCVWDGKNRGRVIKEKNEQLKKKWAGMKSDQRNLRETLTKKAQEKIEKSK